MEVAYLLMRGELPGKDELDEFIHTITRHTMVHEQLAMFYSGFRRDAHPMAIMCGVVGALSAFYHDSTDIDDPHQRMIASHRLIAKRSEEHTSELQSLMRISYAVFCLKKKKTITKIHEKNVL